MSMVSEPIATHFLDLPLEEENQSILSVGV